MKNKLMKGALKDDLANLTEQILSEAWLNKIKKTNTDSLGLVDGKEIISEYLDNNEVGCAFDHLKYIITESNIRLNNKQNDNIKRIREKLNEKK
jgi:hypothetical protein